jgi:phosphatidate phosphatase PAH1
MVNGTCDIIVIQHRNGTYKSTPFYARFGKKEVFRTKDKMVKIKVNNEIIAGLNMKLDENGDGHFSMEISNEERISLLRRIFAKNRTKKTKINKYIFYADDLNLETVFESNESKETSNRRRNSSSLPDIFDSNYFNVVESKSSDEFKKSLKPFLSQRVPESIRDNNKMKSPIYIQKSNAMSEKKGIKPMKLSELREAEKENEVFNVSKVNLENRQLQQAKSLMSDKRKSISETDLSSLNRYHEENKNQQVRIESMENNSKEHFSRRNSRSLSDFYVENSLKPKVKLAHKPSNYLRKLRSFRSHNISSQNQNIKEAKSPKIIKKLQEDSRHVNHMKFSKSVDEETKCELLSAKTKESDIEPLKREPLERAKSSNFNRRNSKSETDLSLLVTQLNESQMDKEENDSERKETQNLSSDQLKSLNLKPGINEIVFSINSDTKQIISYIYLWSCDEKLIVCDIDGTITKSDVRGRLSQYIGKKWFHDGVARLFGQLEKNSYKIIYLSARSFVEFEKTRVLLRKAKMPVGAIVLNPSGLRDAFSTEIRKHSYLFKIEALKTIKNLFDHFFNPFYAGFGNKPSDQLTYRTAGIKESYIFITNYVGTIGNGSEMQLSYKVLLDSISEYFPINNFYDNTDEFTHL